MLPPEWRFNVQKTELSVRQDNVAQRLTFEPWHSGLSVSKKNRIVIILKNALYSFTCVMAFNVPPHPRAEEAERAWLHFTDEEPEIHNKVLLAHLQCEWSQEHDPALLSALQPHPFSKTAGSVQKHSALVFTYRRLNFIKNIFTNKMRETITKKFILRIYRNYISIQFFTFIKSFKILLTLLYSRYSGYM